MNFWYVHRIAVDYGAEMTPDYFIAIIHSWISRFHALIAGTLPAEIVLAIALPLLALLIGIRINRYIDAKPNRTLPAKAVDFIAPLISAVLAIIFVTTATIFFLHLEMQPRLLSLVDKLCVAWLAVHMVMILSSGRTAGIFIALVIIPITLLHLFGIWDPTVAFLNEVTFSVGSMKFNLYLILKSVMALVILLWAVNFVLTMTEKRLRRMRNMRASNRTLILKFMQIGLYIVVFLFAMQMVGVSLTTLSIFSGALGVGIGFGLQKIASNFISGIILLFEKSIEVGDLIELADGTQGTVSHTSGRYTLIQTPNGKDVMIPNEEFITQRVNSLTHSNKQGRVDITVGVSYTDDVALALKLLVDAAHAASRCIDDPKPASFISSFGESGINLQLFFWIENVADGRLEPQSQAMLAILDLFKKNHISIPYPHQVQIADPAMEDRLERIEAALKISAGTTTKPITKKST